MKSNYDKKYFTWQKHDGIFGGIANKPKFKDLIKKGDKVLDFGCGGGYLLSSFENIEKHGVEIKTEAHEECKSNGVKVYKNSNLIPQNYFDLIISNNALEHTENPLQEIKNLYLGLKNNGKICVVVPCDNITNKFRKNDPDFHLFSFSPLNLGNLLVAANFKLIESKPFISKWPPYYKIFQKFLGWQLFHLVCRFYGIFSNKWWQVKAIAEKDINYENYDDRVLSEKRIDRKKKGIG